MQADQESVRRSEEQPVIAFVDHRNVKRGNVKLGERRAATGIQHQQFAGPIESVNIFAVRGQHFRHGLVRRCPNATIGSDFGPHRLKGRPLQTDQTPVRSDHINRVIDEQRFLFDRAAGGELAAGQQAAGHRLVHELLDVQTGNTAVGRADVKKFLVVGQRGGDDGRGHVSRPDRVRPDGVGRHGDDIPPGGGQHVFGMVGHIAGVVLDGVILAVQDRLVGHLAVDHDFPALFQAGRGVQRRLGIKVPEVGDPRGRRTSVTLDLSVGRHQGLQAGDRWAEVNRVRPSERRPKRLQTLERGGTIRSRRQFGRGFDVGRGAVNRIGIGHRLALRITRDKRLMRVGDDSAIIKRDVNLFLVGDRAGGGGRRHFLGELLFAVGSVEHHQFLAEHRVDFGDRLQFALDLGQLGDHGNRL